MTRWFARQRALALTIATTGLSVGGIVITPLSASAIERSGLHAVGPWLALGWAAGILLVTWVAIRPSPQAVGVSLMMLTEIGAGGRGGVPAGRGGPARGLPGTDAGSGTRLGQPVVTQPGMGYCRPWAHSSARSSWS